MVINWGAWPPRSHSAGDLTGRRSNCFALSIPMQPIRLCTLLVACLTPQVARAQDVPDRLRECALAVRVALPAPDRGTAPSPQLQSEAQRQVHAFQASMSEAEFDECLLL